MAGSQRGSEVNETRKKRLEQFSVKPADAKTSKENKTTVEDVEVEEEDKEGETPDDEQEEEEEEQQEEDEEMDEEPEKEEEKKPIEPAKKNTAAPKPKAKAKAITMKRPSAHCTGKGSPKKAAGKSRCKPKAAKDTKNEAVPSKDPKKEKAPKKAAEPSASSKAPQKGRDEAKPDEKPEEVRKAVARQTTQDLSDAEQRRLAYKARKARFYRSLKSWDLIHQFLIQRN